MRHYIFSLLIFSTLAACLPSNDPNLNEAGKNEFKSLEIDQPINPKQIHFNDVIYVPIYSDIYVDASHQKVLLAATLSIRNTSAQDTLYISKVDYFNTDGAAVRSYLESPISLSPMGTVNYVIEKEDDTGGAGANFIVEMSSKNKDIKPLVQAVMIGQYDNKGFSFSTDGYSVK